jgi:Uncharacterised protein family (UPF0175)
MQITIDLPDTLQISETDLRTELAIALFQQQRITLGSASQLAGLHQIEFQQLIGDRFVPSAPVTQSFLIRSSSNRSVATPVSVSCILLR